MRNRNKLVSRAATSAAVALAVANASRAQTLYGGSGYRRFEIVEDYYEDGEAAFRFEKDLS